MNILRVFKVIKSMILEYGISWTLFRIMYIAKLKLMQYVPKTEKLFEKDVIANRIDVFEIDKEALKAFLNSLKEEERKKIISIADAAIEGKIITYSNRLMDYSSPIDWFLNPFTGGRADDTKKWYRIPSFSKDVGDIKGVWEASRFPHFFYMARAYLITSDEKYTISFWNQIESWLEKNPYSIGANWKCGQEAAIRMLTFLLVYAIFCFSPVTTGDKVQLGLDLVTRCYKKIRSNFFYAYRCIRNNHTISEICGWIVGAWCCSNDANVKKGYDLLEKEIIRQFFNDGGYIQFSFNYRRLVLQMLECILAIGDKTNISLSNPVKERIINSVIQMYQLQDQETGFLPNYGANDGALIFPVTNCDYCDYRSTLNTIHVLLEGKRLYTNGIYDEELLWFVRRRIESFPIVVKNRASSEFCKSGLYSLRNNSGHMMIVLKDFKTRPTHMDQLHIDLWYKGRNILCDCGSYSYASDIGNQMSLTASHNTVKVDNKDQMNKHGHFWIYDWSSIKDVIFSENHFKGTMISKNGYLHTRSIKITMDGYQIDDIVITTKEGKHCYFNFHTPYNCEMIGNKVVIKDYNNLEMCRLSFYGDIESVELIEKFQSLYYLSLEKITCISIKAPILNNQCVIKSEIKMIY